MKNILIVCRQEGVAGIKSLNDLDTNRSADFLAKDINRVAKIAMEQGFEVYVCNPLAFSAIANKYQYSLLEGIKNLYSWELPPILPDCRGVILVGMVAKAGTQGAFCSGSYNHLGWHNLYFNGKTVGEIDMHHTYFGNFNVPVLAVSGDTACCKEAAETIPNVVTIETKTGKFRGLCEVLPEEEVAKRYEEGVKKALASDIVPKKVVFPMDIQVDYNRTDFCDDAIAKIYSQKERRGPRTLGKTITKIEYLHDLGLIQ